MSLFATNNNNKNKEIYMNNLKDKIFEGTILEGNNSIEEQGKYLVYVPALIANKEVLFKPLWMDNEVNDHRYGGWVNSHTKKIETAGSYLPLQIGMRVEVSFRGEGLGSGYINKIKSEYPLPMDATKRDSFYLLNKTKGGSYIIQDDSSEYTHICHNNGISNIVLDNDGIMMTTTVGELGTGVRVKSSFGFDKDGCTLQIGNSHITVDQTGIKLQAGDNYLSITETGINMVSKKKIKMQADSSILMNGSKVNITGLEAMNLYSGDMKITGATVVNITGKDVVMDSVMGTFIKGTYVNVDGLIQTQITGPMTKISALTNLFIDASVTDIKAEMLNLGAPTISIASTNISIDGAMMQGLGIATSISTPLHAMNMGLYIGVAASGMAMSMATMMNDPISGSANSMMISSLVGTATPVGYHLEDVKKMTTIGTDIIQKINLLDGIEKNNAKKINDQFYNLRKEHDIK
jgi:hypothetical protein